jgi:hypothetical protein
VDEIHTRSPKAVTPTKGFLGILHFKETVAYDFLSKVISPKVPNRSSEGLSALWATAANFGKPYERHCGGFGYALWATAADLVMRYGPLRGMKQYSKNLY